MLVAFIDKIIKAMSILLAKIKHTGLIVSLQEEQEGDENKKEEHCDDDSFVGTGNGPALSENATLGSSEVSWLWT